ncbi:MAG TPA: Uma2 family endonuclease [Gemmatimonadales bacterium]|jgi:Uma2 family endonuclease
MPASPYYSADAVRQLPADGNRYESAHGELLVTPAPTPLHQFVHFRIWEALAGYLAVHGIEGPFSSPADISWGDDILVQPDLFVAEMRHAAQSGKWADVGMLHLVVEIISPSSLRADRFTKRRLYQEQRIATYWAVDPVNRLVEVWTPDAIFPVTESATLRWQHPAVDAVCVIDLARVFAIG